MKSKGALYLLVILAFLADMITTVLFINKGGGVFETNSLYMAYPGVLTVLGISFLGIIIYLVVTHYLYWRAPQTVYLLWIFFVCLLCLAKFYAAGQNLHLYFNMPSDDVIIAYQAVIEANPQIHARYYTSFVFDKVVYPFGAFMLAFLTCRLDWRLIRREIL